MQKWTQNIMKLEAGHPCAYNLPPEATDIIHNVASI
jgi:hypothetical protein